MPATMLPRNPAAGNVAWKTPKAWRRSWSFVMYMRYGAMLTLKKATPNITRDWQPTIHTPQR